MPEERDVLDEHKSVTAKDETITLTQAQETQQRPKRRKSITGKALPSKARLRFLGIAMIVVVSLSAGFLGGWLGSTHIDNASQSIEKQQVVLQTQSQLISS